MVVSSQGIAGAVLGSVGTALIMKEARREAKPPRIYMQNSEENLQVLKKIPQLTRPILPPWGWDGVLASGIFTMANGIPLGTSEMEPVKLPDGGLLTLDWLNDKASLTGPGCVVLFPGTNNSSHSPYVRRIGKVLADAGFNVVAINYRGILANYQSEKLLGLDAWEDFPFAFRQIAIHLTRPCTCPRNPPTDEEIKSVKMFAIGFSLGGTLLARYIIAQAENDFGARQGMMDVHSTWLPWLLACTVAQGRKIEMLSKAITSQKTRQLISKIGWRKFLMVTDYKDFDSLVIKQNDWPDIRKYWDTHSSQEKLGRGDGYVPMLLIHAEDDKVISPASARVPAPVPPDIIYVESKYGGHLGFGTTDLGWVNQVAQKYLLHISSREKPATAVDQALQERLFSSEERVVIPRSRM